MFSILILSLGLAMDAPVSVLAPVVGVNVETLSARLAAAGVVGVQLDQSLNAIAKDDREIMRTVIDVMETEKLLDSGARVDVMPADASFIVQLGDQKETGPATPALPTGSKKHL